MSGAEEAVFPPRNIAVAPGVAVEACVPPAVDGAPRSREKRGQNYGNPKCLIDDATCRTQQSTGSTS